MINVWNVSEKKVKKVIKSPYTENDKRILYFAIFRFSLVLFKVQNQILSMFHLSKGPIVVDVLVKFIHVMLCGAFFIDLLSTVLNFIRLFTIKLCFTDSLEHSAAKL